MKLHIPKELLGEFAIAFPGTTIDQINPDSSLIEVTVNCFMTKQAIDRWLSSQ